MYNYYLFDLDGTLTKSEEGIYNCIKYALNWAQIPYPGEEVFRSFVGPSLFDSFTRHFDMDADMAHAMVAKYRERYKDIGLFENELYPGIPELLKILKDRGAILAVATSKPTEFTVRILEKFGISKYFDVVVGTTPQGINSDKASIIGQVLSSCGEINGKTAEEIKEESVMIGDTMYDIEGARANAINVIGVLYGYGDDEEIKRNADYTVIEAIQIADI